MILQVLTIPKNEEFLRQKSKNFDLSLLADQFWQNFLKDLKETMASANGIGLAAPQAGQAVRIITVDFEGETKIMINPKITKKSWRHEIAEEGCLSVPKIYGKVRRHKKIKAEFFDEAGKPRRLAVRHIIARIIQHEIDHLDGILFIDKIVK
ncbi:peptide deformylase [Candidatus Kuenenbacteria bacterium RIFCSPLOWO2_12_FULL_42_13]|uniref:Peptide deformylase n=4 Tax=Candidatus Kueneniibacteriota TaxID=1752740 RepID=A0A1F6FZQ2_9BACT|nr:MAG: peptide deformylase [Candidatus Kuenenbacteria bacterium RIFCSPHIGHO2_02_FULL_42_29]OGG90998.1 MAG: peptide deformylase [Candidatus Kuenenbacteria bacterium RIFCSPLOWO2_02_FULL_42_16]OGG91333.1 MAG: peptide deformylase [Candidatus Kuenenbacteria bacterium RIFCSPLOWO2_12_FULL_42_13]OGG99278.1 MAG: peptide deformylase [Candidatus Kuenenbacteria bacterium RIFCSPHIGHO2_12_FULL_42_14]